jgi:hypothetical protein
MLTLRLALRVFGVGVSSSPLGKNVPLASISDETYATIGRQKLHAWDGYFIGDHKVWYIPKRHLDGRRMMSQGCH